MRPLESEFTADDTAAGRLIVVTITNTRVATATSTTATASIGFECLSEVAAISACWKKQQPSNRRLIKDSTGFEGVLTNYE